jgi:TPR repeat protein
MAYDLVIWKWADNDRHHRDSTAIYAALLRDEVPDALAVFDHASLESALRVALGEEYASSADILYDPGSRCAFIRLSWSNHQTFAPKVEKVTSALGLFCYDPQQAGERGEHLNRACEEDGELAEFEQIKSLAHQGDPAAQVRLGIFYDFGEGVRKDKGKAFEWYSKAAAQGNREGLYNLAACYRNGEGTRRDLRKAVELYTKLAEDGDEDSMATLAKMHEDGEGVSKNMETALRLYQAAALKGSGDARRALRRLGVEPERTSG